MCVCVCIYIYTFFNPNSMKLTQMKKKHNTVCPSSTILLCNTLLKIAFAHSKNIYGEPTVKLGHRRVSDLSKMSGLVNATVRT